MRCALERLSTTAAATPLAVRPFGQKDRLAKWRRKTTEKATGKPTHLVQDLSSIPHLT